MEPPAAERQRMTLLLDQLAAREGVTEMPLGLRLHRSSQPAPRHPVVCESAIFIVGQGRKRCYLGEQVHDYDAHNYLVASVPLPVEAESFGTPEEPLLGLAIGVDPAMLAELLIEMDQMPAADSATVPHGLYATPLSAELCLATVRLLECLASPLDTRILGPQLVREITYRVLRGERGGALRALAARHSHFARIGKVLQKIHGDCAAPLDVESLATEANMSLSAFHHHFKAVTSTSPLQYIKTIRLHKARLLLIHEGAQAASAAQRVGYESASQFSREFKRLFGTTPSEAAERVLAGGTVESPTAV